MDAMGSLSPTSKLAQLDGDEKTMSNGMGWSNDEDDALFFPNAVDDDIMPHDINGSKGYSEKSGGKEFESRKEVALNISRPATRQSSSTERGTVKTLTWQIQNIERNARDRDDKMNKAKESRKSAACEKQRIAENSLKEAEKQKQAKEYRANILRQFTKRELAQLKDAFSMADVDGGGSIDESELAIVVNNLGGQLSQDAIRNILKEMDTDGDGRVDFFEYLAFMIKMKTDVDGGRSKTFMNYLQNKIQKAEERREQQIMETRLKKQKMMEKAEKHRIERLKKVEEEKLERRKELIRRNEENERNKAKRLKSERAKTAKEIQERALQLEIRKEISRKRANEIAKNKRDQALAHHIQKQREIKLKKQKRDRILRQQEVIRKEKARKLQQKREIREKKAELLKKFTKGELSSLKTIFDRYDTEKIGKITRKQLKKILNSLGDTHGDGVIDEIFQSVKPADNNTLTFQEFLQLSEKLKTGIGGVKTSFLSLSAKQKEMATKRRKERYDAKNKEIQVLKQKLDREREIHIKRVEDLKKQTKEKLEKKAAEQEQEKRKRMLSLKEKEKVEQLAAERFREKQEQERIRLLEVKQQAMASSVYKRSQAIENAASKKESSTILYQDRDSTMLRVAEVYSQNLQHHADIRIAKELQQKRERNMSVEKLLLLAGSSPPSVKGPQTNEDRDYLPPRAGTSMGHIPQEPSFRGKSGLRFVNEKSSRPTTSGNAEYGSLRRMNEKSSRPTTSGNAKYGSLRRINKTKLVSHKNRVYDNRNKGSYTAKSNATYKLKKVGILSARKTTSKTRDQKRKRARAKRSSKEKAFRSSNGSSSFGLGGVRINPASLNREATYVTEVDNSVVSKRYNIQLSPRPPTRDRLPSRQGVGRGNKLHSILQTSPVRK